MYQMVLYAKNYAQVLWMCYLVYIPSHKLCGVSFIMTLTV